MIRILWASLTTLAVTSIGMAPQSTCPTFSGEKVGTVADSRIREASGLVASSKNPGVLWTHNDSGDTPRIFALTPGGKHLGVYSISGASARDWEDIAIGPGPTPGVDYLFIGDVGDNGWSRSSITIYRVPEPSVSANQSAVSTSLSGAVALRLKYPDGARNCETVMVDPLNGDLYVVSKQGNGEARVYRYPVPHDPSVTATLQHVKTVSISAVTTGGEISSTGGEIIVRTYPDAYLWPRHAGQTIAQAFGNPRCRFTLISEPQGEAICFSPDGIDLYTVSEGSSRPIYRYLRTAGFPPGSSTGITVNFQDGAFPSSSYSGTRDTQIREDSTSANYGGAASLNADGDDPGGTGKDVYPLLRWNLSSIPAGSVVTSASVTLHVTNPSPNSYSLYGLRRNWREFQATWQMYATGASWETEGAKGGSDRGSSVLGTVTASTTGGHTVVLNASGVAQVQAWIDDPSSNHGFILASASSSDGVDFASREAGAVSQRPRLTVTYEGDTDGDGLDDSSEAALGTDPNNPDSDGDGMSDGWEVLYGLNPLNSGDASADADGDGLTNSEEFLASTDPTDPASPGSGSGSSSSSDGSGACGATGLEALVLALLLGRWRGRRRAPSRREAQ